MVDLRDLPYFTIFGSGVSYDIIAGFSQSIDTTDTLSLVSFFITTKYFSSLRSNTLKAPPYFSEMDSYDHRYE